MIPINFSSLNITVERRLQTLAVLHYVFFFIFAPPLSIIIAICLMHTSYWWINLIYGIWVYLTWDSPNYGYRAKKWYQGSSLWKYFADYFPQELIKTADLLPNRNYIIGAHPHGIMGLGTFTTFCTNGTGFWDKFPGITPCLATLPGQFWFPFRREYILLAGVVSCRKEILASLLNSRRGLALAIILGGAEESLECHYDNYDLILMRRKGFARLALETGSDLVPCYSFGENNTYNQVSNKRGTLLRSIQLFILRHFGFGIPLLLGRGIFNHTFGMLPFRTPIHTIIGRPIKVKLMPNPSNEEIEKLHDTYCTELKKLFDEHKEKYGIGRDVRLNLI